jgi:hypothetical protein
MAGWVTRVPAADELRREYPELWAESVRLLPDLSDADRAKAVALVTDTCPHCLAAARGCPCENDE